MLCPFLSCLSSLFLSLHRTLLTVAPMTMDLRHSHLLANPMLAKLLVALLQHGFGLSCERIFGLLSLFLLFLCLLFSLFDHASFVALGIVVGTMLLSRRHTPRTRPRRAPGILRLRHLHLLPRNLRVGPASPHR